METILVTGGLGYIGSHTVVALVKKGYKVIIVDKEEINYHSLMRTLTLYHLPTNEVKFYRADIRDFKALDKVFKNHYRIFAVLHFAAEKSVNQSMRSPMMYYDNNISGLINLIYVMKQYAVDKFIFSSSASVYGLLGEGKPKNEEDVLHSISPYASTKQIGEEIISQLCSLEDFNAISLRYFNPIGNDKYNLIGDETKETLVGSLCEFIVNNLPYEFNIFGSDYDSIDGTAIRDFIHIEDLVDAHIVALERLLHSERKENYEVFNVGTGTGCTVGYIINLMEKIIGKEIKKKNMPRRKGDVAVSFASITKARDVLGWKAKKSLRDALESALKFATYKKNESNNRFNFE